MQLKQNEIHVWSIDLDGIANFENEFQLLNDEEQNRANRFYQLIHKKRFIISHAYLRKILAIYLECAPQSISFSTSEFGKPFLTQSRIQFNMSHSGERAIYAITLDHMVGIDIEKIKPKYPENVVKRYFSEEENNQLATLNLSEKTQSFYRLWARKEALVKALGKGFSLPLSQFSVSLKNDIELIQLANQIWLLQQLVIYPDFQAALATTNQAIDSISHWQFQQNVPILTAVLYKK